eukprot:gene41299-61127_t
MGFLPPLVVDGPPPPQPVHAAVGGGDTARSILAGFFHWIGPGDGKTPLFVCNPADESQSVTTSTRSEPWVAVNRDSRRWGRWTVRLAPVGALDGAPVGALDGAPVGALDGAPAGTLDSLLGIRERNPMSCDWEEGC